MIKIKNKRGDIPVTILVIGVFAICTLAILSFSIIDNKSREGFTEVIEAMEEINSEIEKYHLYKNLGKSTEEINEIMEIEEGSIKVIKEVDREKIIEIKYEVK